MKLAYYAANFVEYVTKLTSTNACKLCNINSHEPDFSERSLSPLRDHRRNMDTSNPMPTPAPTVAPPTIRIGADNTTATPPAATAATPPATRGTRSLDLGPDIVEPCVYIMKKKREG